jgi:hypothetical protein
VFDCIPRLTIHCGGRSVPAFRAAGVSGFYVSLVISAGATLASGLSLAAFVSAVAGAVASFFLYIVVRRAITGRETLVLLEQVWLGLICAAGVLVALRLPVLSYLDVMAPGLCTFLAGGRAGCLMVGCCHGHPSSIGLRYSRAHAEEGFPEYLVDIRLFPVQAIEFVGLLIISALCLPLLLWGREGTSLAWFLFAYAALRFATEGLRGDERPIFGGMSWPRVMSLIQIVFAMWVAERQHGAAVWASLAVAAVLAIVTWRRYDWTRRVLSRRHVQELQGLVAGFASADDPVPATTSAGVSVVVSRWPPDERSMHVSVRLSDRDDMDLTCRLSAAAFPYLDVNRADYTDERTIHLVLPRVSQDGADDVHRAYRRLYARLLRRRAQPGTVPIVPAPRERPWFWRASA